MKQFVLPLIFCATQLHAVAGTSASEPAPIDVPEQSCGWDLRLQPYVWTTAIDGTTGPVTHPADVDAGFDDLFDVIEIAAAMQFEARKGRWGVMADLFYAELGNSGTLPGPLETRVNLDLDQFLGELAVFYRLSEQPRSFIDLYTGLRHSSMSIDLVATRAGTLLPLGGTASGDADWTDPIIGLRSQWDLNERWYLAAKADIGGFGVDSDFTWNVHASVGYRFNEMTSLEIGYRYFDTDYSSGRLIYDAATSGAVIGVNFEF